MMRRLVLPLTIAALLVLLGLPLLAVAQPIGANGIQILSEPSGTAPQIKATGPDTNISVNVIPKGGGCLEVNGVCVTTGGSPANATYLTATDESIPLPNSRQLLAGTNITFDDSVPNQRTVNASGGGGDILSVSVTLHSADILGLGAAGFGDSIELIAAPASGTAIIPLWISLSSTGWDYTNFGGADNGFFFFPGAVYSNFYYEGVTVGDGGSSNTIPFETWGTTSTGNLYLQLPIIPETISGTALYDRASTDGLNFSLGTTFGWTGGTADLTITIWYRLVTFP